MSGLCGWIGGAADDPLARARRMAAPLDRAGHADAAFTAVPGRASALAGVGVTVVQHDAVRILVWGTADRKSVV